MRFHKIGEVAKDEAQSSVFQAAFAAVAAVLTGLGVAAWAALRGQHGPQIFVAALLAVAAVLAITWFLQRIRLSVGFRRVIRFVGVMFLLGVIIAAGNWMVGLVQENESLKSRPPASGQPMIPEDPDHARQLDELERMKDEDRALKDDKRNLDERIKTMESEIESLTAQLRDKRDVQASLDRLLPLKARGDQIVALATKGCRMSDIPNVVVEFSRWGNDVRSGLRETGYGSYIEDFNDNFNCPEQRLPTHCSGWEEKFIGYYNTIRCRASNLKKITDRLRERSESFRP